MKKKIFAFLTAFILVVVPLVSKVQAYNSDTYMPNPGIGWQEAFDTSKPLLTETVSYRRSTYSWKLQNPAENVYDWSLIDNDLNIAIAQGKQLAFRIYTNKGGSFGGEQVPLWVKNAGAVILANGDPDYSNCIYQSYWAKFVDALKAKYDGNPNIAFIDISGYGQFNEWSWNDQTQFENDYNNPKTLDGFARNRLVDIFLGGSANYQCKNNDGSIRTGSYNYSGLQKTQLLMPYAGISQSSKYANSKRSDVGFRFDCLGREGSTDQIMTKVGTVVENTWRNAPVAYEFCGDPSPTQTLLTEAGKLLALSHGSIVHDNFTTNRNADAIASAISNIGYKYSLTSSLLTTNKGGVYQVNMDWKNIGIAPSYPKMGQNFELHLYAFNASTNALVSDMKVDTDISKWLPGVTMTLNTTMDLSSYPQVKYTLKAGILDTRTQKLIHLANTTDSQNLTEVSELSLSSINPILSLRGVVFNKRV